MAVFDLGEPRKLLKRPVPFRDGEFTLIFRRPTFEEQTRDIESTSGYVEARFDLLKGWEDLKDVEGKEIAFDLNIFKRMCEIDPRLLVSTSRILSELFVLGIPDEGAAKNAKDASGDSSGADETIPPPEMSAER